MPLSTDAKLEANRALALAARRREPHIKNATVYGGMLTITFLTGAKFSIPINLLEEVRGLPIPQQIAVGMSPDGKEVRFPLANINIAVTKLLRENTVQDSSTPDEQGSSDPS